MSFRPYNTVLTLTARLFNPCVVIHPVDRNLTKNIKWVLYNNTAATRDSDRIAITNQALRDLSGCNRLLVSDWIDRHNDEVISHSAKFGMENKKNPSNPASYANKGKNTDKSC
ncbi:MAG: hypothetical protein RM049_36540 [Nostoc sp. DedQUE04]|uniref:hypothetical protein n=1 Tax=Nostoc sp. DedQUE04 TaxID=3075390 RepID=UPI002AD33CB4|nr:hypothetical protein [Nostoc sp. DedQUE04]MDZ8140743.1 hypothetical protein [Nostoc sp. DedQUE04]